MPTIENAGRWQKATLWDWSGSDAHGRPVVSAPRDVWFRWEGAERIGDPNSERAPQATRVVFREDLYPGSIVWLGGWIADMPGTSEVPEGDLHKIVSFERVPDLKARHWTRTYNLERYGDALPTVV